MKIRIYLKSGVALPDFPCEEFNTESSKLTGELTGYSYKGGLPPRPMYVDPSQIAAVVRLNDEEA